MSQKNETTVLILALLITAALLGAGFWWFTQKGGFNLSNLTKTAPTNSPASPSGNQPSPPAQPNTTAATPPPSSGEGFAQVQNIPTGLFNYGGSTSFAPIRLVVDAPIQAARPEFSLRYVNPTNETPGSGTGIKMLIEGRLDFAQSSRPLLEQEYQQAQRRGFNLQQIPVAIDGLAVAVNPNLNISGLTVGQLRGIYTGQITNWQQVGGPNVPIKAFSRRQSDGGTVELFVEEILGRKPFAPSVQFTTSTTDALRKLAGSPGGIYYASAPEVVPQCSIKPLPLKGQTGDFVPPYQEPYVSPTQCPNQRNQLNIQAFRGGQYPITRNLFVVVKQNGQREQQAGTAYANLLLSAEGQELISKAGFVKIR